MEEQSSCMDRVEGMVGEWKVERWEQNEESKTEVHKSKD